MKLFRNLKISLIAASALFMATSTAHAVFLPVIDEFWIERNGSEIFRDSFNNGILPQSEVTGSSPTYGTAGIGGFIGETTGSSTQGELTMNPALGNGTLIPGTPSNFFTGATRRTSISGGGNELNQASSFAVHGLFDLASSPETLGDAMGIRLSDRVGGTGPLAQEGDDVMSLSIRYGTSGDLVLVVGMANFVTTTITVLDTATFNTFSGLTPTQVELVLSKEAGLDTIGASFTVFDQFGSQMQNETMFVGTTSLIPIFNGEDFTRGQFYSVSSIEVPIPEPGPLAMLTVGLVAYGFARRKRSA